MSHQYVPVLWNRQKKRYDAIMLGLMLVYLLSFVGLNLFFFPQITAETLLIRAFGSLALLMLHIILCIGPLTRLDKRFLPFLYNRRHLGVSMFLMGLIHGGLSLFQFHALGNVNPFYSLFTSNVQYTSVVHFPFQTLGFFALVILFLMAATSHDFWLQNLSPRLWKSLHMLVYIAYALLIMHVMTGTLQFESSPILVTLLGTGMMTVIGLHLVAGIQQAKQSRQQVKLESDGYVRVARVGEIPNDRAKRVETNGERIAVFRFDDTKIAAVSDVCKHQNGPLSEGKVVDGCITCPWHGYQYLPHNGCSPPPFDEKIPTYDVKIVDGVVFVHPQPYPAGTEREVKSEK